MSGALLSFIVASGLTFCAAILFVAVLVLRTARRYVDLAEERLERLHENQAHLLALLEEERRGRREDANEREGREREGREREAREEQELDVRTRRGAERSIERSKRELLELRRAHRRPSTEREGPSGGSREDGPETRKDNPPGQPRRTGKAPQPAGIPETRASAPAGAAPEEARPRVAVYHPHPDDDVTPVNPSPGKAPEGSPVQMFRVFYDRYLDNYEGYVKLAGRLRQERGGSGVAPGSPEARKLEERLARINDGIERTVSRLDILEEYNPELATDDRISRRADIARSYSELDRRE